jgi:glycosyltransferase involved in cell wall biosynthesis
MVRELSGNRIANKLLVWSAGADNDNFTVDREFPHDKQNPLVLYVGRVSREKGLDDLCKLQDRYRIRIVGDGPYRETLASTYKKVEFVGYKVGSELSDCYNSADVFCFPSQTDTFGIVNIEAMIHGTPVAAYPITGPVDIVKEGVTGYLGWDLGECIDKCLLLDRAVVKEASKIWTWRRCWEFFRDSLLPAGEIGLLSFNIPENDIIKNIHNNVKNIFQLPSQITNLF